MAAILLGLTLPLTPAQLLWVNMVTAVTLALALAFEPTEPGVMHRPPRPPEAPILSGFLIWRVAFVSALLVAGTFGMFGTAALGWEEWARILVFGVALFVLVELEKAFFKRREQRIL